MPWHCPVPSLGGAFAEHQLGCDMGPGLVAGPGSRDPQGPPGAQACHELSLESAAAVDIEGLVDRFVADAHGLVIGELDPEPVRDLLRAPSSHPPAVRAIWLVSPFPLSRRRPSGRRSVRAPHLAREPFGHIAPQTVVLDELGRLGTTSDQLGLPQRDRRPILQLSAAGGRISAQLPGDRRRAPTQPASDRSHTETLSAKHRDLLSLAERLTVRHPTPPVDPGLSLGAPRGLCSGHALVNTRVHVEVRGTNGSILSGRSRAELPEMVRQAMPRMQLDSVAVVVLKVFSRQRRSLGMRR